MLVVYHTSVRKRGQVYRWTGTILLLYAYHCGCSQHSKCIDIVHTCLSLPLPGFDPLFNARRQDGSTVKNKPNITFSALLHAEFSNNFEIS